jgi:hypothetical protein
MLALAQSARSRPADTRAECRRNRPNPVRQPIARSRLSLKEGRSCRFCGLLSSSPGRTSSSESSACAHAEHEDPARIPRRRHDLRAAGHRADRHLRQPVRLARSGQTSTQVTVNILSFILAHAIVAAPILYMIAIRRRSSAISVADAFTCGFLFGFGADLVSVALTVVQSSDIPTGFSIVPPFVVSSAGVTLAGYAYWTGLTAMLFVAVARFSRQLPLAYLAAAAAVRPTWERSAR